MLYILQWYNKALVYNVLTFGSGHHYYDADDMGSIGALTTWGGHECTGLTVLMHGGTRRGLDGLIEKSA